MRRTWSPPTARSSLCRILMRKSLECLTLSTRSCSESLSSSAISRSLQTKVLPRGLKYTRVSHSRPCAA